MLRHFLIILVSLILGQSTFNNLRAQDHEVLWYELRQSEGKAKVKILLQLSEYYLKKSPIKSIDFSQEALKVSQKLADKDLEVRSHFANIDAISAQYDYSINYTAKEGERISDVCERFGVSREELRKYNYLPEGDIIDNYDRELTISSKLKFIQPTAYQKVLSHYEQILQIRRQTPSLDFLIFALRSAGDFHQKQGDFSEAEKYYQEWLKIRREQGDSIKLIWVLHHLADFYTEIERSQDAAKLYEEILAIDKVRLNTKDYAFSLSQMSLKHPNSEKARLYAQEALKYALEQNDMALVGWHRDRNRFQNYYYYYDYDENESEYEQMQRQEKLLLKNLELHKAFPDTVMLFRAYRNVISFNLRRDFYQASEKYSDTLWQFMEKYQVFTNPNYDVQRVLEDLIYIYANNLEAKRELDFQNEPQLNSLYRFKNRLEQDKKKNWKLYEIYLVLDKFYRKNEQYDSAAFFFEKYRSNSVEGLDDVAFLYQKAGNYSQSLQYFEEALEMQTKHDNLIKIAEQLNKIGYLYEVQMQVKTMDSYYKKALKLLKTPNVNDIGREKKRAMNVALQFWRIAQVYEKRSDKRRAISFAKKSFGISTILDDLGFSNSIRHSYYGYEYPKTHEFEQYLQKLKEGK